MISKGIGQVLQGLVGIVKGLASLVFSLIGKVLGMLKAIVLAVFGFNPKAKFIMVRVTGLMLMSGIAWVPITMSWVIQDPVRASLVMADAGLGAMTLYRDIEITKTAVYNKLPEPVREVSSRYHLAGLRRSVTEPLGVEKPSMSYRAFKLLLKPITFLTGGIVK